MRRLDSAPSMPRMPPRDVAPAQDVDVDALRMVAASGCVPEARSCWLAKSVTASPHAVQVFLFPWRCFLSRPPLRAELHSGAEVRPLEPVPFPSIPLAIVILGATMVGWASEPRCDRVVSC